MREDYKHQLKFAANRGGHVENLQWIFLPMRKINYFNMLEGIIRNVGKNSKQKQVD